MAAKLALQIVLNNLSERSPRAYSPEAMNEIFDLSTRTCTTQTRYFACSGKPDCGCFLVDWTSCGYCDMMSHLLRPIRKAHLGPRLPPPDWPPQDPPKGFAVDPMRCLLLGLAMKTLHRRIASQRAPEGAGATGEAQGLW